MLKFPPSVAIAKVLVENRAVRGFPIMAFEGAFHSLNNTISSCLPTTRLLRV